MENRNGLFQIVIKATGTFIKLYPPIGNGKPLRYDELNSYLTDQRIFDYDVKEIGKALEIAEDKPTEVRLLSVPIHPINESIKITISSDRMSAHIRFYPASNKGKAITDKSIINSLNHAGVKYGIIKDRVDALTTKHPYCEEILIAKGLQTIEGNEAEIIYHFNVDRTRKPKINSDGSVDFHQLDMISSINKGDLLATLVPAIQGKQGKDVMGTVLQPKKIVPKRLKFGKEISLSEDELNIYSDVSGHVRISEGKVMVSNTYEVLADVDSSTGDIVYEGNVHVKGNVITGFAVRAKGDIIVDGVVEGALLLAGGQIVLKRGMQGMSKGRLEAKGNVISKFIENAVVKSGGYITTEAIMHSKVSAKGDISVGGKKGFITGGEIRSGMDIIVKTAGSTMGTNTVLEVGIDPEILDEFHAIEKVISGLETDLGRLLPIVETFKQKISEGEKLSQDKIDYIRMATENCIALRRELKKNSRRRDKLQLEINNSDKGSIRVEKLAYPGVKIVISNVVYFIRKEVQYARFIRDRADIKIVPY